MTTRRRRKCRHWGRAEGELRGSGEWRASPRSSEKEIRLFGEKVSSIHTELEFRERAVLAVPLRMGRVPAVVYWLRRPAHKRSRPIPKHERNDAIKSLRLAMELDWYGVPPTGHGLTARGWEADGVQAMQPNCLCAAASLFRRKIVSRKAPIPKLARSGLFPGDVKAMIAASRRGTRNGHGQLRPIRPLNANPSKISPRMTERL